MTHDRDAVVQPAAPRSDTTGTHLLLVRHGETVWHADNRYAGAGSDIDLTDFGRTQARELARWAATAHLDAIAASPVRRALETARPSADALGLDLVVIDDLKEVDFGVAEGRTTDELLSLDPDMVHRFRADPAAHPYPGSESPGSAADRAAHALRQLCRDHLGGTVLVVAHNTLLRLGICRLLGLPVARYRQLFPRLDNASITELLVPADPGELSALLRLNAGLTPNRARAPEGGLRPPTPDRPTAHVRQHPPHPKEHQ